MFLCQQHLRDDILSTCTDEIECNALLALLDAVMGAARMVLSVRYMLIAMGRVYGEAGPAMASVPFCES